MIKITRNLEELKKELSGLGPRKKHIKRGRTVMKIVKPTEVLEYQSQATARCREATELKEHFHRLREIHKYDRLLDVVLVVTMVVTQSVIVTSVLFYFLG